MATSNVQIIKGGQYRITHLDEVPNLQTLIDELRGGRKLWIESTNVFVCLYSSRIWDECEEVIYAESSMVLFRDDDDMEELSVLSPENDRGAVAAATARILQLPDDYYQSVVTHGDKTNFLDGFIGTSFFTGDEMLSFFSKNAKRQYIFESCTFDPQQAAALLKSSTTVDITLSGCSFDEDCHFMVSYIGLLLDKKIARSGAIRFEANRMSDPIIVKNLKFMEHLFLDKLILASFNVNEDTCRRLSQAKVTSLALENCTMKDGSGVPLTRAISSGTMFASTLIVRERGINKPWLSDLVKAIGSPRCLLKSVCFEGVTWSPELSKILVESLRTNNSLQELAISAKPSDFDEQWKEFLDVIGSSETLRKVMILPQPDTCSSSEWVAGLEELFRKNHRVDLLFHSNDSNEKQFANSWNKLSLEMRFRSIPRLDDDGTRAFVLTSAMVKHSNDTNHLYSLLKANQEFISMIR
ncbi:hypothetical protein FisN_16Lh214 [Fistulifera solaris]|uniref:Uncharacterized protein n=1 Tax=Fistulifera solaris TaxID=1519565 RepID=A0A1Z5J6W7_FISSO|nr:hypothetical protein FisN_16Lh214 [Fistulifera solaris]|eukprot:GAX09521.1 hypothetical protein FisN_16Lh214 [Fistulifera solaris]